MAFDGKGMITQRNQGLFSLVTAVQVGLAFALYWGLFFMFDGAYRRVASPERYVFYCALMIMGLLLYSAYRYRSDASLLRKDIFAKHRSAVMQTLSAITAIVIFLVATKDGSISRLFLFCMAVALYAVLFVSGTVLPFWLARQTFRGNEERTILVGPGEKAWRLREWLLRKSDLGIQTIGVVTDEPNGQSDVLPVLGGTADFERIVEQTNVTQIVLVELPLSSETLNEMVRTCEKLGVRLLIFNDLQEKIRHAITHFYDDGFEFFGLRNEPLQNPLNRSVKRVIDIVVALPVVLLILPVLALVVWLFQRVQSPGPIFYSQERNGFQKQRFRIWKFRTMHVNNPSVTQQASANDSRIYPAGHWFRKLSIDEFPQFINVLKGDMSVVGPRPHLPEHDEQFARLTDNFYVRKFVKPGITGLAQVNGFRGEMRDTSALLHRLEYDIEYLENWSLGADLSIIAQTAVQVVKPPKTAY
jgi:exopolysaccharide biosynthesis polyprenyl glycosylphosphotransferase